MEFVHIQAVFARLPSVSNLLSQQTQHHLDH